MSKRTYDTVLDASALLAALRSEPGAAIVAKAFETDEVAISAVNHSECVAKLMEGGMKPDDIDEALAPLSLTVVVFDEEQSWTAAELRATTRSYGLSLGDRACLALATVSEARVLTADRAWAALPLGLTIEVVR